MVPEGANASCQRKEATVLLHYDVYEIEQSTWHGNWEGAEGHAYLGSNQLDLRPTQRRGNSCLVLET